MLMFCCYLTFIVIGFKYQFAKDMNVLRTLINTLFSAVFALFLVSCGGGSGGGDDSSADVPTTMTGVFIDSVVSGLNYTCSSGTSGVTDVFGNFTCNTGDDVTFYIGNFELGTASADAVITPLTLYPDDVNVMINLVQLLQTIDVDGNPSNGITLDSELIEIVSAVDFSLDSDDFDRKMSYAIGGPLVDSEKAVIHMNQSLEALGESHLVKYKISSEETDENEDGISESIVNYYYNDNGLISRKDIDNDGDGVTDESSIYTYDSNLNLISSEDDRYGDSIVDVTITYEYDDNGNEVFEGWDAGSDAGSDGEYEYTITSTYNEYGMIVLEEYDHLPIGSVDETVVYIYDSEGRPHIEKVDIDNDGNADYIYVYTYNDAGQPVMETIDEDGDGVAEVTYESFYDDNGEPYSYVTTDSTGNRQTVTFVSSGNTQTISRDIDGDGTVDATMVATMNENDDPMIVKTYNGDTSGTLEAIQTFEYDENGNRIKVSYDIDGDGTVDSSKSTTWVAF